MLPVWGRGPFQARLPPVVEPQKPECGKLEMVGNGGNCPTTLLTSHTRTDDREQPKHTLQGNGPPRVHLFGGDSTDDRGPTKGHRRGPSAGSPYSIEHHNNRGSSLGSAYTPPAVNRYGGDSTDDRGPGVTCTVEPLAACFYRGDRSPGGRWHWQPPLKAQWKQQLHTFSCWESSSKCCSGTSAETPAERLPRTVTSVRVQRDVAAVSRGPHASALVCERSHSVRRLPPAGGDDVHLPTSPGRRVCTGELAPVG